MKKFYNFRADKENDFVKLSFVTKSFMNKHAKIAKQEGYSLYESNLEPLLRYYYDQKILPNGWLEFGKYVLVEDENNNQKVDNQNTIYIVEHN